MIDWKYAELFKQTSVKKTYVIGYPEGMITNEDLILESVEISEAISNDRSLKFGGCISSSFKFKTKDVSTSLIGKPLAVSMVVKDDYANPLPIGCYVARTETLSTDGRSKTVNCYDALYDVLNTDYTDWYNYIFTQVDEMTISQFRFIFFEFIGIPQKETSLILDDYVIHKQNIIEKITGNMILSSLCEINACYGKIGRNGVFEYVKLDTNHYLLPSQNLYPSNLIYPGFVSDSNFDKHTYISCKAENYIVQNINYVALVDQNGNTIAGHGDVEPDVRENKYIIGNNLFVYSLAPESADNAAVRIYGQVSDIYYQPFNSKAIGNPCMETGDAVRIQLLDGRIINSYVFKRTLKGIHGLTDDIGSSGTEYVEQRNTGVASDVRKLKEATSTQRKQLDMVIKNELKIVWVSDESKVGSDPYTFYCIAK